MKRGHRGFVIGMTGGVAVGKSVLAGLLRHRGAALLSLDEVAHSLYEPGRPVWHAIIAKFGRRVLGPGSRVDRRILGRLVFGSRRALETLDGLVHPALRGEASNAISRMRFRHQLVVVEAGPLLFRLDAHKLVDAGVLVICRRHDRIRRLMEGRGMPRTGAEARLAASLMEEKVLAGRIRELRRNMTIVTSGDAEQLRASAARILGAVKSWT